MRAFETFRGLAALSRVNTIFLRRFQPHLSRHLPLKLLRRAQRSFVEYHAHATFKTKAAALIGMVGFPTFYFVWAYLLPQPFECLSLRILGFVLSFAVFALPIYGSSRMQSYDALLSYVTLWYTVPFFFTFMLLMNGASTVWQLSLVSGFVYLVLLCDPINACIQALTASLAAYAVFWFVSGGQPVPIEYLSVLPVLAFVLCGVAFLNYSNDLVIAEKMRAIGGLAAYIAHEMRTPLLGIRLDADKVGKTLPELLEAAEWARAHGWPGRMSPALQKGLPVAMERISQHTISANGVIDMLLMNAAATRSRAELTLCSARRAVDTAVERYHFRAGQRALVDVETSEDFDYLGVEVLMVHVLFNLLRNALRAIDKAGTGRIKIALRSDASGNEINFRDSGPGMTQEVAARIFLPFYSNESIGIGTGIGLAFCRAVVESFDATIVCSSEIGVGTEFVISLPHVQRVEREGHAVTASSGSGPPRLA